MNKPLVTYSRKYGIYRIGPFDLEYELATLIDELENPEFDTLGFIGSERPEFEDPTEVDTLDNYIKGIEAKIENGKATLEALTFIKETFTDVEVDADFYPRESDYNTFVRIPYKQFKAYIIENKIGPYKKYFLNK
jgi:hypothetical protein